MKLFFYYAFCSIKNQLKKLFKTWVLIFLLACLVVGGLIGFGASVLSELADTPNEELEELPEEEIAEDEIIFETSVENPGIEVAELIAGALIFALFFFGAISADKSGNSIFLPADVNLLFPSPMKPQSVLLFRLLTQIGVILLSSVYLMFQIPNLVMGFGLSAWSALGILATWLLAVAVSKLLQILLYTVSSTHTGLKKYLRKALYATVLLIAGAFYLYSQSYEGDYFAAAVGFFNHDLTRWIPLWGWIKGLAMFAVEENLLGALLCLGATLICGSMLGIVVWHIKADFYEDAMAKSQETAELQEAAQADGGTVMIKRKKDRSEKLKRDGMRRGYGANIFFYRVMYNRFRFAHFGFLTKTSETYLVVAVGVALLCKFVLEVNGLVPVIFVLAGLAFFRTLGNPLEEDTSKDFFRLIPENTFTKLFWSVLGGTATCLMDLIPGLVLATVILGINPLTVLAWIPFILSIDFYGTNVGVFINLSVPGNAGKPIKQIVQIMFIYFGLLPDIAIMAIGIIFGYTAIAAIAAAAFNCALGAVFLALTPLFIDYPEKPAVKSL